MQIDVPYRTKWVRAKKYEELSGCTVNSIKHNRTNGQWKEGRHWVIGPDGNVWVNPQAIDEWVESRLH